MDGDRENKKKQGIKCPRTRDTKKAKRRTYGPKTALNIAITRVFFPKQKAK